MTRRSTRRCDGSIVSSSLRWRGFLFQLDRLVAAVVVDRRSPYFVRRLVFCAAKIEGSSEAKIDVAHTLEIIDQLLGIDLRAGPFQGLDQDVGGDIAFE